MYQVDEPVNEACDDPMVLAFQPALMSFEQPSGSSVTVGLRLAKFDGRGPYAAC